MTLAAMILSATLVVVTAYYAWQTRRTVDEMRLARGTNILPRVTLSFDYPGANLVFVVIANNGVGPALDVEAEIRYEPGGPTNMWKAPLMVAGERHRLLPPNDKPYIDDLRQFERLVFTAHFKDALGDPHEVVENRNPGEYWDALVKSRTVTQQDPIDQIHRELEKLTRAVERFERTK